MNKLTNNNGISLPIAVWLAHDTYDYDDRPNLISVTGLLKPTRQIVLGRKFSDASKDIDVEVLIASSMGTALHDSVEVAWKDRETTIKTLGRLGYKNGAKIFDSIIFEKRSELELFGFIVSGKFDISFAGYVQDVKSTTVYAWMNDSNEFEHKFQLSAYKLLNPDIITKDVGYIEYIFTDWSKAEARRNRQYPQSRVATKEVQLFTKEEMLELIEQKLYEVVENEKLDEPNVIQCSEDDLWATKDVWKYYKNPESRRRATKVFDNESEANQRLSNDNNVGVVVRFMSEAKRCKYCNYTDVCSQYAQLKKDGRINE